MRDHDALRARLLLALTLGVSACEGDGEPKTDPKSAQAEPAEEPPAPEGSTDESKSSGGMAKVVQQMREEAKASADEGKGSAEEPPAPKAECGAGDFTLSIADAKGHTPTAGIEEHGCPIRTNHAPARHGGRVSLNTSTTQALRDAGDTDHCCYRTVMVRRGRPFIAAGRVLLPEVELGAPLDPTSIDEPRAQRVAAAWLEDARMEWASVASFERAAEELRRLGAPEALRARYHHAADQERRHAALCLRLAERFSGRTIHLGALPPTTPRPGDRLACLRQTFTEGCVAETAAALVATRSARSARPDIARVLVEIAEDEADHAALAWLTIGWGLGRCTAAERARFIAWARQQRPEATAPGPDLDRHLGRLSPQSEQAIAADAWTHCIEPLLDELERPLARPHAVRDASPGLTRALTGN